MITFKPNYSYVKSASFYFLLRRMNIETTYPSINVFVLWIPKPVCIGLSMLDNISGMVDEGFFVSFMSLVCPITTIRLFTSSYERPLHI